MSGKFSKEEAKKNVFKATAQHPLTLYSVGMGILGGLGTVLFGGWVFPTVATGGFLVGSGFWAVNYFGRRDKFLKEYFQRIEKEYEQKNNALIENVKTVFNNKDIKKCAPEYSRQGLQQYEMIGIKFQSLSRLLEQKLQPGEITHARYFGMAEQVYFSVLDNLQQITDILQSACGIDQNYIQERVKILGKLKNPEKADEEELRTMSQRLALQTSQFQKVNALLTQNEMALTQLDKTTSKLAVVRMTHGRASIALEDTLKELEELAERADKYSA